MIAGTDMKMKRELSRKQQKVISYASVGLFLLMLVLICAVIGREYFSSSLFMDE